ncbi:uncharacterized protein [Aristolochia californica]|uniref:uncharacterized protein n=1 Tax=Aristolochia californica TaxID=171875 RepID=UPI0035D8B80A
MEDSRTVSRSEQPCDDDDEFYEKIEAPKFVDFTLPDQYIPDDRAWFCLRLGCNQEHTEDMDPDTIYKSFVLRVMAARSPNVKLSKALSKNRASELSKCPLSAPPKSSRIPRLAVMSSIAQKNGENKVKVPIISKFKSTPSNTKVKQSGLTAKALTAPRNQRPPLNPEPFRSYRKPKLSSMKQNNRTVVKALVFGSPKKAAKATLDDLPIKAVCTEMKKLKISSQSKYVPSRYASSLNLAKPPMKSHNVQNCKGDRKVQTKEHPRVQKKCQRVHLGVQNGSSGEIKSDRTVKSSLTEEDEEKVAVENASTTKEEILKSNTDENKLEEKHSSLETFHGTVANAQNMKSQGEGSTDNTSIGVTFPEEEGILPSSKEHLITEMPLTDSEILEKKRDVSTVAAEEKETMETADKENASAFDSNRDSNLNLITKVKKITPIGAFETQKRGLKEGASACTSTSTKYKKTKPTNPKPFRLRTDERGILKEANSEKRRLRLVAPVEEQALTSKLREGNNGGQSKGTSVQSVNCHGQPKEGTTKESKQIASVRNIKKLAIHKLQRSQDGRKVVRLHQRVKLEGKELVSQKLDHTVSHSRGLENSTISRPHKTTEGMGGSRSISCGKKRPSTIPKEPIFHRIHVPKTCTKKAVLAT